METIQLGDTSNVLLIENPQQPPFGFQKTLGCK